MSHFVCIFCEEKQLLYETTGKPFAMINHQSTSRSDLSIFFTVQTCNIATMSSGEKICLSLRGLW